MTDIDLTAVIRPTSDAIYRQLSGQYGDFGSPSDDEVEAILTTALPHILARVEVTDERIVAEIDRLNAIIQRVREIVTDPQTVGWIERDGDTAWIPAERIRKALGIPEEPLSKRHPAMSREDLRRAFEGGEQ